MISLDYRWTVGAAAVLLAACSGIADAGGNGASATATATATATDSVGDSGTDTETDTSADPNLATAGSSTDAETSGTTWNSGGTDTGFGEDCQEGELVEEGGCCQVGPGWPMMLSAHKLTLTMTVDGVKHEGPVFDDAEIVLVDRTTGDRVPMGRLREGVLSRWILPGDYDVVYEAKASVQSLPRNHSATIRSSLAVYGDLEEPINIEPVDLALMVRVNGSPPPPSVFDSGMISVSQGDQESRTLVGSTAATEDGELSVRLIAGDYEVFYESEKRQLKMPYNALAKVGEFNLVADGGDAPIPVPLKLEVMEISGELLFDDEVPPLSPLDHGSIYLRDVDTGSLTKIADTADGAVPLTPVLAGATSYDLFYAAENAQTVPANAWGRLNTAAIMDSDDVLSAEMLAEELVSLSIPTMSVTGVITVDGMSKPADPKNRGELLIGDMEGDRAELGDVSSGISSILLRSDYDVFFRHDVSNGGLPSNTFGRVQETGIVGDNVEPLAVDIPTTLVSGKITINGATPPASVYADGEVFLRNVSGDRVFLGQTRAGAYERRVVDGTYDVFYAVTHYQSGVPANHETKIMEGVEIADGAQTMPIAIATAEVSTMLPALPGAGKARFFLRQIGAEEDIFVGKNGDPVDVSVIPGNYQLVYRMEQVGSETPSNEGAVLGCYTLE